MLDIQPMFDCFVSRQAHETIAMLQSQQLVNAVHPMDEAPFSTCVLQAVAQKAEAPYTIIYTKSLPLQLGYQALHRILCVAEDSGASLLYADHYIATAEGLKRQPLIDYQKGSIRDDFQMGSLLVIRTSLLKRYFEQARLHSYQHAGLYDLRLYLSLEMLPVHIGEYLYTEVETDLRKSGEKQFDYVDPRNQSRQKEMERAATRHLRAIGAYLSAGEYSRVKFDAAWQGPEASVIIPVRNRVSTIADAVRSAATQQTTFAYNIIVIDNHSTDGTGELLDALQTELGASRLVILRPTQKDLGIGGCWNLAVHDGRCGRFAVQLDSDDLYSGPDTLQRIVDKFHEEGAAMVIGSYRMCNFQLETLPPGLIDHREWTDNNGRNNALRINGLGAPRAFYTPILRQRQIPNTSYGEDYALGLMLSRTYRISRIYDELYLCRRWEGNSDAALEAEAVNRNNHYKDFLRSMEVEARQRMMKQWSHSVSEKEVRAFHRRELAQWQEAAERYEQLAQAERRELALGDATLAVQWNPARIVSTGSKIDKESIAQRPCFLCEHNRPAQQHDLPVEKHYQILVNPFPILPGHLTIITRKHQPQQIYSHFATLRRLAWGMGEHIIFYNGAGSGASCPDHCHLQAGERGQLPLERDWTMYEPQMQKLYPLTSQQEMEMEEQMGREGEKNGLYLLNSWVCPVFVILSGPTENDDVLCKRLYEALPVVAGEPEPRMNAICWRQKRTAGREDELVTLIFPRKRHRPACYPTPMVSPGALDMGGLLITPQEQDFRSMTAEQAANILREVSLSAEALQPVIAKIQENVEPTPGHLAAPLPEPSPATPSPEVSVGILSAERVSFRLNGVYRLKGESITGEQEVTLDENGLNWQGQAYSELTLRPLSADSTFTLRGVTIGKQFHWQRQEEQTFQGKLRLVVAEEKIVVINKLPVEQYLKSVISSEMKATCPPEFLKASAVISRSWLMAQMQRRQQGTEHAFFQFKRTEEESIRWHDQEEHTIFDVCADDHCQRYQGVTRATSEAVSKAVEDTAGRVLTFDGEVCDARFAKCCGGVTNDYENCWESEPRAYLTALRDVPVHAPAPRTAVPDLSDEAAMRQWVMTSPESACNTTDEAILSTVLNDYDRETTQFYRWTHTLTQADLQQLLAEKMDLHLGDILALEPVERGRSGHLVKLRIRGSERSFVIGKELEIRRVLSPTHLLSSAFVVDAQHPVSGVPQQFVLHGAGWGHGVGMCQIGAAVMGSKGFTYGEILQHYYQGAEVSTLY
ncbi:MAG: DUF4922 domain-containing protein [Bacteroidaceae bacterium]|nr:DUF4922 domain-containing protein [Prevotellaceae bacterium]MDY5630960.1 DUF4922 domain-containing protein [Bacteroidaceae bacterium]